MAGHGLTRVKWEPEETKQQCSSALYPEIILHRSWLDVAVSSRLRHHDATVCNLPGLSCPHVGLSALQHRVHCQPQSCWIVNNEHETRTLNILQLDPIASLCCKNLPRSWLLLSHFPLGKVKVSAIPLQCIALDWSLIMITGFNSN